MRSLWNRFNHWWCQAMHDDALWPAHGEYRCRRCMRVHAISWANQPAAVYSRPRELAYNRRSSFDVRQAA